MDKDLSLEIMHHRFSSKNIRKSTGHLCLAYGMERKEYEKYVKDGMRQEAEMLKKMQS